jgi:hypothetical protein
MVGIYDLVTLLEVAYIWLLNDVLEAGLGRFVN